MEHRYEVALDKAIERLRSENPNLRAVLLGGSITRGEGGPTSDLDLWCIIDADYRIRHTWIFDDVIVEVFLNPYQQILKYFAENDEVSLHLTATGKLVYGAEDDPILQRLRELAQEKFAQGSKKPDAEAGMWSRYMSVDMYDDLLDVTDDPESSRWVGSVLLAQAMQFYLRYHGKWPYKPKYFLHRLQTWHPELAGKVRTYLANGEPAVLKEILEEVYAPMGGIQHFTISSTADETIPLSETEIILIRHGWPAQDKTVSREEWVLDFTAYLELARYLDVPALSGVEAIYTSPLIKARQTAGFYFAQWQGCRELTVCDDLREARCQNTYIANYSELVSTYLSGGSVEGFEELAEVQKRAKAAVTEIATQARKARKRRIALVGHGLFFAALVAEILELRGEDIFTCWKSIPYGPYAVLKINAFGDIAWSGEVKLEDDTEGNLT